MHFNHKFLLVFLILALSLLSSCSSLRLQPHNAESQSILVLPVEVIRTSINAKHGFKYVYEIRHVDEQVEPYTAVLELPLKGDMLIIDSLPPGTYYVDKFYYVPVGAGDFHYSDSAQQRDDGFQLVDGKITIFSQSLRVEMTQGTIGGGLETRYGIGMIPVTQSQLTDIGSTLQALPNFSTWEISITDQ